MDTHNSFLIKFFHEPFTLDLVQRTMMKVCSFLWVFVCDLVLSSFRHLIKHLVGSSNHHENRLDTAVGFNEQEEGVFGLKYDGFGEEEEEDKPPEFAFGFQFQIKEEDLVSFRDVSEEKGRETEDVFMENELKTSKYQFMGVKDFGGFVAEPEVASFTVHELFMEDDSKEEDFIMKKEGKVGKVKDQHQEQELDENLNSILPSNGKVDDFIEAKVFSDQILQRVDVDVDLPDTNSEEKSKEFVVGDSGCEEVEELEEKSQLNLGEKNGLLKQEQVNWLGEFFIRNDNFSYGVEFSDENESNSLDHHQLESDDSSEGYFSISPQDVHSASNNVLETSIPHVPEEIDDDDFIDLQPHLENLERELQNTDDSTVIYESEEKNNSMESENDKMKSVEFEEEDKVKPWVVDSYEEEDEDDVLLEHQELIGQMKMELKNARTGGLPTILEESETPRMKEDMKPLKINEKLEHRDQMAEIQKFYKSYTEKMRKLDVLNYQTLQAINFLRMKHPEQLNTGENASLSALKSVIFPSFWPCKLRRIYADPTLKSVTELHKDLEIVYVGHACLSWEILHWQYKKAKELQLYDPQGYRSYNQVAIEFQQFHVLLRRFSEDEMFQGPRVQNYAKQRCILRGLLQVPPIKDDNLKEKKARKEEGDAVPISTMANMIKESMTVFWEFLHSDKDTTNLFLTIILQGSKAHLQDPADSELFMEIKATHQKKERRLKDMLRTGNCIVKKFQKQQETILDQHMFVSQVELKLVSRVLSLPRLSRDQLVWCQSKLNNIKFIDRKIQVEDSLFLLFPC
ncbi:hypothetical protein OSB04_018404 [Centaurea solstitialis]|uniref:Ribosomal protein L34Ae n=1 Tax=Centaurea solstitialis TaxID=347529 RepID=A0AA38WLP3_9ASTR|nr:hypothetical protein OSB04_018404 [Centaurea solstitialis]